MGKTIKPLNDNRFLCFNLISLLVVLITLPIQAQSQHQAEVNESNVDKHSRIGLINLNVGALKPLNNFSKYFDQYYVTYGLAFYYQVKPNIPSFIGLELSNVNFQSLDAPVLIDNLYDGDASTTNGMLSTKLNYRYYLPLQLFNVELFLEGCIGFNWHYTSTTLTELGEDEGNTNFDKNDLVSFYGGAVGFNIPINESNYIQARAAYLPGLSAEYLSLNKDEVFPVNSTVEAFVKRNTTTDVIRLELGYIYAF